MESVVGKNSAAIELGKLGAAKGGFARAASLTAEERSAIARNAVAARWNKKQGIDNSSLPKATHVGELKIGDMIIPCAVLADGRRVISQRGVGVALNKSRSKPLFVSNTEDTNAGIELPFFLGSEKLIPFISNELLLEANSPILYLNPVGGGVVHGLKADILPKICEVWLDAYENGGLLERQHVIAKQAYRLMKGLARTGIIALVDEATGYQEERDKSALQKILEKYIAPELLPWTKRFPDVFYQELFRLRGWGYSPMSVKRPGYVGKLTNKLVYEKLPPGVLEELREKNPVVAPARRAHTHHQFLTADVGNTHLNKQLQDVILLMRISRSWHEFEDNFNRAFPGKLEESESAEAIETTTVDCAKEA